MYKKHTFEDRVKYVKMLDEGYTTKYIERTYGFSHTFLKQLYRLYQEHGVEGLNKKKNIKYSAEQKLSAIREYEKNELSLDDIYYKYNLSRSAFLQWRKKYQAGGIEALMSDGRGRQRKDMGRPKKRKEPQTELEKLQEENLRLRIENALLKKVDALMREKEARLKGIGQKSSKN